MVTWDTVDPVAKFSTSTSFVHLLLQITAAEDPLVYFDNSIYFSPSPGFCSLTAAACLLTLLISAAFPRIFPGHGHRLGCEGLCSHCTWKAGGFIV